MTAGPSPKAMGKKPDGTGAEKPVREWVEFPRWIFYMVFLFSMFFLWVERKMGGMSG
jgi:hypothetical protein